MSLNDRLKTYTQLSDTISCLSNIEVCDLISKAKSQVSIGGKSHVLIISGIPVFVKIIPLTDVEKQPKNILATNNIFNLPLFYQYGVGSTGFSIWRELETHIMTTQWVLEKECPNFPLLYHWRILQNDKSEIMNDQELENLEKNVKYWENSSAIRHRLESLHQSSNDVILFLEYVPQTLYQWLESQLKIGGNTADSATLFVDNNLKFISNFITSHDLIHFDAHFWNILTDGEVVYISDFGLALSSKFDLSSEEINFLNTHRTYDRCATIVNFVHCLITSLCGQDQWDLKLKEYACRQPKGLTPLIASIITKYIRIAQVMDEFYQNLQKKTKLTPYPKTYLEHLLSIIDEEST